MCIAGATAEYQAASIYRRIGTSSHGGTGGMPLEWMSELNTVLNRYAELVDVEFLLAATENYCEAILQAPEIYIYLMEGGLDLEAVKNLRNDIRKLRWKWYNELIEILEG